MPTLQPIAIPPERRWYQFRLSYLLYLLTLTAVVGTVLRPVIDLHTDWHFTAPVAIYMVAWALYLGIRIPILIRRWRHKQAQLAARRQQLVELSQSRRMGPEDSGVEP